jgi:hypothetical protein
MATPAQIEANRRNARKSTGPKTAAGKAASSRNALTHGLTAAIADEEVRAYYEIIRETVPLEGEGSDAACAELRALDLATAEARLARARRAEVRALSEGDSAARLLPEIDRVDDCVAEDAAMWKEFTVRDLLQAARLKLKLSRGGNRFAASTYRRQSRYLKEAERQQAAALRSFLQDGT